MKKYIKRIWTKIKEKIEDHFATIKILKSQINKKNQTIQEQADTINGLIKELNEYKEKNITLKREERETKQQLRFLTKRDNKLQAIEQLFEGKGVKLRDITKILEGDE